MKKRRFWITAVLVLCLILGCAVYLCDYYRADQPSIAAWETRIPLTRTTTRDGYQVYIPQEIHAGLIFYPGGKVDHNAYEPLLKSCAQEGILCVLVDMPFHLAVLNPNAADGIPEEFPQVDHWYLAGHSLGGAMAASYLADHHRAFSGLILLGAYSSADLSGTDLAVLSIYGSEDQVLNREKYRQYLSNLPDSYEEQILDGGCHAYFGMYGSQKGDGTPSLTCRDQILITADLITRFILEG